MKLALGQIKNGKRTRKDMGDIDALAASIREIGLLHPIVVDANHSLVSGERRFRAAKKLQWDTVPVTVARNLDEARLLMKAERDENTCRKDFTPSEAVAIGESLEKLERPEAMERKAKGQKSGGRGKKKLGGNLPPSKEKRLVRHKVGTAVGMSGKSYENAKKVISAAGQHPELQPVAEEMDRTGNVTQALRKVKEFHREQKRQENAAKVSRADVCETIGQAIDGGLVFSTLLLDPPWEFGDEGDVDQFGRGRPDYAQMPVDRIRSLKVGSLADKDAHLYLWITNRSLPKGFSLIEAWGFRYVTCVTWCKPSYGMGNYFRGQTEHLLFGVRGSMPLKRKNVGTHFSAPRGKGGHSSKPAEAYELIESCSPGPFVEIFARCKRPNWTSLGADA